MTQTQKPDVDIEQFIELLNEDLGTEFQSIVQYTNHIATIAGAEYLAVLDELKVHLGQELTTLRCWPNRCRSWVGSRRRQYRRSSGHRKAGWPSRPTFA